MELQKWDGLKCHATIDKSCDTLEINDNVEVSCACITIYNPMLLFHNHDNEECFKLLLTFKKWTYNICLSQLIMDN